MERMEDEKVNITFFCCCWYFCVIFPNLKLISTYKPCTCDPAVCAHYCNLLTCKHVHLNCYNCYKTVISSCGPSGRGSAIVFFILSQVMNKCAVFTSHRLAILYFSFLAREGTGGESRAHRDMTEREKGHRTVGWQVST